MNVTPTQPSLHEHLPPTERQFLQHYLKYKINMKVTIKLLPEKNLINQILVNLQWN